MDDAPTLVPFGPAISLHSATVSSESGGRLEVALQWSTQYELSANYGISLRIVDQEGRVLQAVDTQPGYGYTPTTMWRPGELVPDRYLMPVPPASEECSGCSVHVILYQVVSGGVVGEASLGPIDLPLGAPFVAATPPRLFAVPRFTHQAGAVFGGQIELAGYEGTQAGGRVHLTLWWRALQRPTGDYTVFVHLTDPASGEVVVQSDSMPRAGTYPTSWWVAGEVVSDTVTLSMEALPDGDYALVVGLYDQTITRLRATDASGAHLDADVLPLQHVIEAR
jgi:hypothetical protein